MTTHHKVKSWPEFFTAISEGQRTHELRRNDRAYKVGDTLELNEYTLEAGVFTGRVCSVLITSITSRQEPCAVSDEALNKEFCILSVKLISGYSVSDSN